ncbi:MAG: hypothetical protein ABEJ65_03025 [bacterium]
MSRLFRVIGAVILSVFLCYSSPGAGAESLDFRKLKKTSERVQDTSDVTWSEPVRMWSAPRPLNFLETGELHGELLWVVSDKHKIMLSQGRSLSKISRGIEKTMDGTILSMDLHSLPNQFGSALLTVIHEYNSELLSTLFYVRQTKEKLSLQRYKQIPLKAVRPVGDFLYQQRYDPGRLWQPNINRLGTSKSKFKVGRTVTSSDKTRLLSMTSIGNRRFLTLDKAGNLRLLEDGSILDQVDVNFGLNPVAVYPRGDSVEPEPVRIPPVWLFKRKLVVTVNSPDQTGGVQNWLTSEPDRSRLRVFHLKDKRLHPVGRSETYPGIITDLEVSSFNPNQVIWIRRTDEETILEVVDFTR